MDGISSDSKNSQEILGERESVVKEFFSVFLVDYQRFQTLDDKLEDLNMNTLFNVFKFVKKVMGKSPVEL